MPIKKANNIKVFILFATLCNPMDYTVHEILQARIPEWVAFPFSRGSSQSGIEPRSPTLQVDSLPSEPPRKTKNTRVGSLSLLQWIFPTQESNWGLLHCRWILYQLSDEVLGASTRVPTHDKVMRESPDGQGESGLKGAPPGSA